MANNRMYLIFKPTGHAVYIGKRMGWGWYDIPDNLVDRLQKLFELAEENSFADDDGNNFNQEGFCLAFENAEKLETNIKFDEHTELKIILINTKK